MEFFGREWNVLSENHSPNIDMSSLKQPHSQDTSLLGRIEEVIERLGFDASSGLVRSGDEYPFDTNRHVVRQALTEMDVEAVFGFSTKDLEGRQSFTPIVYMAAARDGEAAKTIHRLVWSQGVVPMLLIATPERLEIRRSLAPPVELPAAVNWSSLDEDSLPSELTSLTSVALRSSIVWRDLAIDRSSRVDKALLEGIVQLSKTIEHQENGTLDRSLIHAVIGRFLYLYVLLDRRVIDGKWIAGLTDAGGKNVCSSIGMAIQDPDASHIVWPAKEVWHLFDYIDLAMNGAVFPIGKQDRGKVGDHILHLIHRVIRHGDHIGPAGHQLSFLDVSFATLRTETISAIYELFLALESEEEQSDDGAFYTPPFLVDYVLGETDRVRSFDRSSRVLDPAAGSGIFLVGAFRRILERSLPYGAWSASQFRKARKLLETNIFGIERNSQAANVCRFSLYLTLLDYMSGRDISTLTKMAKGEKVFPPLLNNIVPTDVFSVGADVSHSLGKFTHVVGNPPWGSFGDSATRTNEQHTENRQHKIIKALGPAISFYDQLDPMLFPVTNKRLSELFIWKIKKNFLDDEGAMGLLISTRSFVSRSAGAFPNALAKQFQVTGIANLSHFRYRLFAGARSPTIAIFARNRVSDLTDKVWVYAPLLSSQPIGDTGHLWSIIVSTTEVEQHRLRDLCSFPEGWFDHLILRPLDRRYARHLRQQSKAADNSLASFLEHSGFRMTRGGTPAQTGLPDRLLLKAGNYRRSLGLDGFGFASYPHSEIKEHTLRGNYPSIFGGNILLIPRSMNDFVYVKEPVGFSSTFNAIYSVRSRPVKKTASILKAVSGYLASDVASYLYALVGKSWILDHARLEKYDLLTIPFPFFGDDDSDLEILSCSDQSAITSLLADRVGLDSAFVKTVREYTDFRNGYEDSQMPRNGLLPPSEDAIQRYKAMLLEQIQQGFGSRAHAELALDGKVTGELFAKILLRLTRDGTKPKSIGSDTFASATVSSGQFNPLATISYDRRTSGVIIVKPWTCVAWTLEQAYSDARNVSAAILRAKAAQ